MWSRQTPVTDTFLSIETHIGIIDILQNLLDKLWMTFPLVYLVHNGLQPWDPVHLRQPEQGLHLSCIISFAQTLLSVYYRHCLLPDGCSKWLVCGHLILVNVQQLSEEFWWFHFCFEVTQLLANKERKTHILTRVRQKMPGSLATPGISVTCWDLSRATPVHLDESCTWEHKLEYFATTASCTISAESQRMRQCR